MDSRDWDDCPIIFIPATFISALFQTASDNHQIPQRIAKRFNWNEKKVNKWLRRIFDGVSIVLTFFLVFLVVLIWYIIHSLI